MSYTWFKLHHELPDDIKLRRFTPQEKWAWVVLLCLASKGKVRGMIDADNDDIAEYCEFNSSQDWLYFRDKLIAKGMLEINEEGWLEILHWNDRQYEKPSDRPEAVKARVRKHRSKQKTQNNADETPCNALQESSNADETPQIRLDQTRSDQTRQEKREDPDSSPPPLPDPIQARFAPKPWRKPDGSLDEGFCEFVGKLIDFEQTGMHHKTKGRGHILNLQKGLALEDLEKLQGYWDDYQEQRESGGCESKPRKSALQRLKERGLR